jgi:4'-phosphopantetheinyl transferase EntD
VEPVGLPLPPEVAARVRIAWRPVHPPYGPAQESAVPREADGRPRFPAGYAGSISHTGRLAVALVAPGAAGAGVDIEDAVIGPRVARFVLRPAERGALLPPAGDFTPRELFAAKEAAFKALYGPPTSDHMVFWRVELNAFGNCLEASYRGLRVPVWIRSEAALTLAVAIRTHS